jgi:hypothetical protein
MGVLSNADQMAGGGLYVNVNGSAGEVTTDPITGQMIVAVNTKGNAGVLTSPSGSSLAGISSNGWMFAVIALFIGALLLLGRKRA